MLHYKIHSEQTLLTVLDVQFGQAKLYSCIYLAKDSQPKVNLQKRDMVIIL